MRRSFFSMANSWFRFKKFAVEQSGAAMKVGTDGVLLGAWARVVPGHIRWLDVGTGTGLIALMVAQRTEAAQAARVRVDAVEVDGASAAQALANVASSPWSDRIGVYHCGIQDFVPGAAAMSEEAGRQGAAGVAGDSVGVATRATDDDAGSRERRYHHIVSNPPWFVDSLRSPHAGRNTARHTDSLSYGELLACAARLLVPDGLFSVVLPADSAVRFLAEARAAGFGLNRRTAVSTLPAAAPKRVLLELAPAGSCAAVVEERSLTIETGEEAGCYTEEYRRLTGDFYLRF